MTPLETALVILISIWTIIFILVGIGMIVLFIQIRKAIDKVNQILQTTEDIAERVEIPIRTISAGILGFIGKISAQGISSFIKNKTSGKR